MTVPDRPAPAITVVCHTCGVIVAEGGDEIKDGQPYLTSYADASCPKSDCPQKTPARTAIADSRVDVEISRIKARLTALERKP